MSAKRLNLQTSAKLFRAKGWNAEPLKAKFGQGSEFNKFRDQTSDNSVDFKPLNANFGREAELQNFDSIQFDSIQFISIQFN